MPLQDSGGGFTRTQSLGSEQSVVSLYNEAVKYNKAGLVDDAENKFRQALLRNKRHVSSSISLTVPFPLLCHPFHRTTKPYMSQQSL